VWRFGKTEDETETESYRYHNSQVWQVAFRPNGKQLAAASWDSSISVWNLAGSSGLRGETTDLPEGLHGLAIHPDGRTVALGGADGNIYLRGWDSRAEPAILRGQGSEIMTLAYSGRGSLLASGGFGTVAMWDMRGEKHRMWIAKEHNAGVFGLAFSPDEKTLISFYGVFATAYSGLSKRRFSFPLIVTRDYFD
jgi:WD40 repeat protein